MEFLDIKHPNENHFRINKLSDVAKEALKTWPDMPTSKESVENYISLVSTINLENRIRNHKIDIPYGLYLWQLKQILRQYS